MHRSYGDIRELIDQEPLWFDDNAVPRYAPFHPQMLGVYAHYAVLVEIGCQGCWTRMKVGVGMPSYSFSWGKEEPTVWSLALLVDGFHYGDPPRHGCIGDTMNCYDYRILEAWERWKETTYEWQRNPEYEIELEDGKAGLDDPPT